MASRSDKDPQRTDPGSGSPAAAAAVPSPGGPSPWLDRLVEHFVKMGTAPDGVSRIVESTDAILSTARQLADAGRWTDVLRLVRVAESAFAFSGRWGAWRTALGLALDAARNLGDRHEEGWALHQLGVRSLGLQEEAAARDLLGAALEVREAAGEHEAAELTRTQLELVRR